MAETLQEFETPDAAGKAAKALESYQEKTDDLVGEKLTQHGAFSSCHSWSTKTHSRVGW